MFFNRQVFEAAQHLTDGRRAFASVLYIHRVARDPRLWYLWGRHCASACGVFGRPPALGGAAGLTCPPGLLTALQQGIHTKRHLPCEGNHDVIVMVSPCVAARV